MNNAVEYFVTLRRRLNDFLQDKENREGTVGGIPLFST